MISEPGYDKSRAAMRWILAVFYAARALRIDGVDLPAHPNPAPFSILLGGHTPRIEAFGDIVTSIVNPSHRLARDYKPLAGQDGKSPMTAQFLNDVMTTQQLVDIAAFLRVEYDYIPPPPPPHWDTYPDGNSGP